MHSILSAPIRPEGVISFGGNAAFFLTIGFIAALCRALARALIIVLLIHLKKARISFGIAKIKATNNNPNILSAPATFCLPIIASPKSPPRL